MKYYILHVFRISIAFKKKFSEHFKDIYKLKLLTSFNVNMTHHFQEKIIFGQLLHPMKELIPAANMNWILVVHVSQALSMGLARSS